MTVLNIAGLNDKPLYTNFIDRIRSIEKKGLYSNVPGRNWILSTILPRKKITILDIGSCRIVFRELLEVSQTSLYEYHTLDIVPLENKPDWINEHLFDCNNPGYPVPDGYFDLIICSDVIEHIKNHEVLIEECKKKLKDDGTLFLTTPNYSSFTYLRNILAGKMHHDPCGNALERYCFTEHVRYFTTLSLIPYLQQLGMYTSHVLLSGLSTEVSGRSPLFRLCINLVYNRLCIASRRLCFQTILILQKTAIKYHTVKCPRVKVI